MKQETLTEIKCWRMGVDDAEAAANICRRSFAVEPWSETDWLHSLDRPERYRCTCATLDGQLAGVLCAERVRHGWDVQCFAVAPKYRRNGVASAMLKLCMRSAPHCGTMVSDELVACHFLLRRLGWKATGVRRNAWGKGTQDGYVFEYRRGKS